MYDYRKMTPEQRIEVVQYRREKGRPPHSLPHWEFKRDQQFLVSAACYEHVPIIGATPERMTEFEKTILETYGKHTTTIYAWCLLPNHYHILLKTDRNKEMLKEIGLMHGRTSFEWNGEENRRGRKVWYRSFDRDIKSHRHFWASMNYVHNNAVHHGYVEKWQDWPWSSAPDFLERVGAETAKKLWLEFPVLDYGKSWDFDPELPKETED
jgi:putative transposase